jgi:hypothetical protein
VTENRRYKDRNDYGHQENIERNSSGHVPLSKKRRDGAASSPRMS